MSNDSLRVQRIGPIPQLRAREPVCICSKPFVIDGQMYYPVSPSCEIHGIRSDYIPQVGKCCSDQIRDAKRFTQVSGKAQ